MAFGQEEQHQAHDPTLTLYADDAKSVSKILGDYHDAELDDDKKEALKGHQEVLDAIGDDEDGVMLSPERAKQIADVVDGHTDAEKHGQLYKTLRSVAHQHTLPGGKPRIIEN